MRTINIPVLMGLLFSAIGTASLFVSTEVLTAAIWLCFGNGLLVANLQFKQVDENGNQVQRPVPRTRVVVGVFLIVMAVMLLGLQIFSDVQQTPQ